MAIITFGQNGTRPYCTLEVTEQSQSIEDNATTVKYELTLIRPAYVDSTATKNWSVTIEGVVHSGTGTIGGQARKTLLTGTQVIQHNSDGTKTISFSGDCNLDIYWSNQYIGTISGSGSMTLTPILRYATITQSLSSKTETTATVKWTSNATCDKLWSSIDNGSTWNEISIADSSKGSYIISGLNANTTYQIKTRIRRKDTQLTTDSSAMSVTTYDFPYCNSMPNFTIGSKVTLGFYNPLGRSIDFYIIANGTQISNSWTITGVSYTGLSATSTQNQLYATIPNAKSATYQVKVVCGSNVSTKTGRKYSVNQYVCQPEITGVVDYSDTNATTIALTGNNKDIVRNRSTLSYSASGITAKNGASISSCTVSVNGVNIALTLSGSSASGTGGVIDSGTNIDAVFTVTDSRGLTSSKRKTITMIDWHLPSAIISFQRHNNFYTETDLTVDADYTDINGHNQITITYQATKEGDSSPSVTGTLTDNVTSVINLDNNYAWTLVVTLVDSLGGTTTYSLQVSRGMPIIYFDRMKSSVGVNCFPVEDKSFEVNGYSFMFYKGETFGFIGTSQSSPMASGVLTNSGKRILFSFVLPKFNPNLTVTVSVLGLNIWQDGSYILDSSYVGSGGYDVVQDSTITVTHSINGNLITFSLDKSTAYNGTNNSSVEVQINSMTLVFS